MQLFLSELYEQRGIFARGLAHPITFMSNQRQEQLQAPFDTVLRGRTPGLTGNNRRSSVNGPAAAGSSFENFGAVVVSPRNYYRLLQTGQNVLLFPGGAKEALSGDRNYPLQWVQTKTDFVRTAARFNAIIIPFSAIGMAESFNVVLEPEDVLKLPIIGPQVRDFNRNMTKARYDAKPDDEIVTFPLALPAIPQRNYFLFGPAIDTTLVDPKNITACSEVYKQVQNHVRKGIDDLRSARTQDPFQDTFQRYAYERFWNKKAPTFPIDILN